MDAGDKKSDAQLIGATLILAISWLSGLTSPPKINKLPNHSKMDPNQIFLQASIVAAVFGHVAFFFNIWELERYDYPVEAAVITSVLAILVNMVKTSSRIAFEKIDYYISVLPFGTISSPFCVFIIIFL